MKKEHSVFITITMEELSPILNREFRRLGLLKDVPSTAEAMPYDDSLEVSLEYKWEEK